MPFCCLSKEGSPHGFQKIFGFCLAHPQPSFTRRSQGNLVASTPAIPPTMLCAQASHMMPCMMPPNNAFRPSLSHDALHDASCWPPFARAIASSCLHVVFACWCMAVAMAGPLNTIVRQILVTPADVQPDTQPRSLLSSTMHRVDR